MKLLNLLIDMLGQTTQYYVALPGAIIKVDAKALEQLLDSGDIEETDVRSILP